MTARFPLATRAVAIGVLTIGALALAAAALAQQEQRPELPTEVREWLERDQLQRWSAMIRSGQERFNEGSCYRCHGENGSGGDFGPDLTDSEWVQTDGSLAEIQDTIFWGVRRRDITDPDLPFQMNPEGGMDLEWEEIQALAAYVWSLNNGDYLPQR